MSGHWQLGIESSTGTAGVALACSGRVVAEAAVEADRNPSTVLMGPLRKVLEALPPGERLAVVVIGTGPASYNGARVGLAAGQGVALVAECPAVGICSLEAVAAVRGGEPCLAVGDARRETFFTLPFAGGRLSGRVELLEHAAFVNRVEGAEGRLISFEEAARLRLPADLAAGVEVVRPEARGLIEAWNARSDEEREALCSVPPEPFYLREPYVTTAGKSS